MPIKYFLITLFLLIPLGLGCSSRLESGTDRNKPIRSLEDWNALRRTDPVRHIVCSGSGALRLITYLDCSDKVVAVEQVERSSSGFAPYRLVHSEYSDLPLFGEGHGRDNIEFLLNLDPKPDLIVRIDNPGSGIDPQILQERTGIPVVLIPYGDLGRDRFLLDRSIRLLGTILNQSDRADALLAFFDEQIADLNRRTENRDPEKTPQVYLGGLSYRGSHGINSTSIAYPPFDWLHLKNPASELRSNPGRGYHAMISKEQLLLWNPDYIFVDLGTLGLDQSGGLTEIRNQTIYHNIKAVQTDRIYGLYPNNSYNTNLAAMIANAWFIGKTVFPDQFQDINVEDKIKEIYQFMLNDPFIQKCPDLLKAALYKPLSLNQTDDRTKSINE